MKTSRKSKTVTVRGRRFWRSASELKPTWKDRQLELESAKNHFEAATAYFQKTVTAMRDAAAECSRAATRLTNARRATSANRR